MLLIMRNKFIASIGIGFAAFCASSTSFFTNQSLTVSNSNKIKANNDARIAVVGAGLAGLTTAHLLNQEGFSRVKVFEATNLVGGRVRTLHFTDDLYAEAGALSICDTEVTIRNLVTELGLELVHRKDRGQNRYHENGGWRKNSVLSEPLIKYIMQNIKALKIKNEWDWFDPKFSDLDHLPLQKFLQKCTQTLNNLESSKVISRIQSGLIGLGCDDLNKISVLDVYRFMHQYASSKLVYSITGGNDRLPLALAHSLNDGVLHLRSPITHIEQRGDTILLTIKSSSGTKAEEFDYVVMAVPLSMLNTKNKRAIEFTPSLPTQTMIQNIPYNQSISRVYFEVDQRFWLPDNLTAMVITDKATFWIEDHTAHLSKKKAILEAHASGPIGHALKKAPNSAKLAKVFMSEVYPEMKSVNSRVRDVVIWDETMPYQAGAYPYLGPGQMHYLKELRKPFGRIFFAGEYTSIEHPVSMNGAVRSAYRVVDDLKKLIEAGRPHSH